MYISSADEQKFIDYLMGDIEYKVKQIGIQDVSNSILSKVKLKSASGLSGNSSKLSYVPNLTRNSVAFRLKEDIPNPKKRPKINKFMKEEK